MKLLMLTIDKDCGTDNATIDNWLFFEMGLIWEKIFPKPWSDKVNTWKESTYNEICAVTQFINEKAMGTWNS